MCGTVLAQMCSFSLWFFDVFWNMKLGKKLRRKKKIFMNYIPTLTRRKDSRFSVSWSTILKEPHFINFNILLMLFIIIMLLFVVILRNWDCVWLTFSKRENVYVLLWEFLTAAAWMMQSNLYKTETSSSHSKQFIMWISSSHTIPALFIEQFIMW